MGNYDGYITIGTKIDTKGMQSSLKSMESSLDKNMKGLQNTVGKTMNFIKTSIIAAGIALLIRAISQEIGHAVDRLDTMKNYENVMSNLGISSKDAKGSIQQLSEELKGIPTTLDSAAGYVQQFAAKNNNLKASTEMYLGINNAILAGGQSMQVQKTAMEQLTKAYAKGKPDADDWYALQIAAPAQLNQVAEVMGYGKNASDQLGQALKSGEISMNDFLITVARMNKEGVNGFKPFGEQAKNSVSGIRTSFENLKTAIVRGLANIMDAIGQSNIASFFDGIRNAIDRVVPYIQAFVKLIATAVSYIAGLFGKKVKKQSDDTADSISNVGGAVSGVNDELQGAGGSASKLNKELKQLASFDEMNVLQDNKSSSGGSGGGSSGGGSSLDLSDMDFGAFDDVQDKVDEIYNKMVKKIKEFVDKINSLGFDGIITHIKSIGNSLIEIFTDPKVLNSAVIWKNSVLTSMQSIITSVAKIGINIADGLLGSIDLYLQQNKDRIKESISNMFKISAQTWDITGQFAEALANISDVFKSPEAEQIGADIIAIFYNPLMTVLELMAKFSRDIITLFFQPIIANSEKIKSTIENVLKVVQPLFDTLAEAVTYISDKFNQLYDEHLKPFFEALTEGFTNTFGKFLDFYNEYMVPFIDKISQDIQVIWETYLKPFVDSVVGLIGSIIDAVKLLYEKWLKPVIDFIIQNILPIIVPILQQLWNVVSTTFKIIISAIKVVIDVIKGVIDFLIGVFTGDWEKAWNAIKGIVESIWNGIKNIVSAVIDGIKNTITNVFNIIKNTISAILEAIKLKFSTVFNNIKNVVKTVIDGIKNIFINGWNAIWSTVKGIINSIIGGVEKLCNAVVKGLNKVFEPLSKVGNKVLEVVGIKSFKFSALHEVKLPRVASGAIINQPGRGVPIGSAIAGEAGREGVLPLTDERAMEMLGREIGKWITVNNNIPISIGNRQIARVIKQTMAEDEFAMNYS